MIFGEKSFEVKITGMQVSPFDKTVFLDTDTFVCHSIDDVFEFLDYFDLATTLEPKGHSVNFWKKYQPNYSIKLRGVLHEFNTGVVGFNNSPAVADFFSAWLRIHRELNMYADMPTFREAYLQSQVKIGILPHEYNFTGLKSLAIAYGKVRVIHDRLGEKFNDLRPHMADFEFMDRLARRINKTEIKRLVVPYLGVIPYNFSPYYIKQKIKRMMGIKTKKKRESFIVK